MASRIAAILLAYLIDGLKHYHSSLEEYAE